VVPFSIGFRYHTLVVEIDTAAVAAARSIYNSPACVRSNANDT